MSRNQLDKEFSCRKAGAQDLKNSIWGKRRAQHERISFMHPNPSSMGLIVEIQCSLSNSTQFSSAFFSGGKNKLGLKDSFNKCKRMYERSFIEESPEPRISKIS